MRTLVFTANVIVLSDDDETRRIARTYQKARRLISTPSMAKGAARPRILACMERFNEAGSNIDRAGWMLVAIQERLAEQNLPGWQEMTQIADAAERVLRQHSTLH